MVTSPPDPLHLNRFYKKYLNANGIPVTSSWRVPDSAMVQAWKIIDFMTGDLSAEIKTVSPLKKTLEKWIPIILSAQEPDGYLQTA